MYQTGDAVNNPVSVNTLYQLTLNPLENIASGDRAAYTVTRRDVNNNGVTTGTNQSVYLFANGTTGSFYGAASGGTQIYRVIIPVGSSSADFWFTATKPGTYTITASDKYPADGPTGLRDATDDIIVSTSPASQYLVTSSATTAYPGGLVTISAQLADKEGNPVTTAGKVVSWGSTNGGEFSNPKNTNGSGIATVTFKVSSTIGTQHIVTATSDATITGTSSKITVVQNLPANQAHGINFANIKGVQAEIKWTNGTGAKRAVFIKQSGVTSATATPVNNISYTAVAIFEKGSPIGNSGWYCVFNGAGNGTGNVETITVTGLYPELNYQVQVFEYNGEPLAEQYLKTTAMDNPKNVKTQSNNADLTGLTTSQGDLYPTFDKDVLNYSISVVTGADKITFTPTFTGSGKTVAVGVYPTVNSGSASGELSLNYGPNTIYVVVTAQDATTKTYTITIVRADGSAPTEQAHDITFTSVTTTSMTVNWVKGNGTNRVAFIKQASSGVALPDDGTTYPANVAYGVGTPIGSGWYCILNDGSGASSVSVSGLSPGTGYIVQVFEYNGTTGAEKFNTSTETLNPNTKTTAYLENLWSGATDTDWNKTTNWTLGHIPTSSDNVSIGNIIDGGIVVRYPEISAEATCNNILIASSASITILSTGKFDVGGSITNNHGANGLIIRSSGTQTGSMIVLGATIGSGTVERYTINDRWYLISPPANKTVKGFLADNWNIPYWQNIEGDANTITDNYAFAQYLTASNIWGSYFSDTNMGSGKVNETVLMGKGTGYKIRTVDDNRSPVLIFKGELNVGSVAIPVTHGIGDNSNNSWNCVGNPYTSAICLNSAARPTDNLLDANIDAPNTKSVDRNYGAIYYWKDDGSIKTYESINKSDGESYAQVGQAFFIKGNISDNSLNFTPAMQVHKNEVLLKSATTPHPQIQLVTTINNAAYATKIRFIDGTTNGLDVGYDAGLFRADPNFALYTRLVEDNGVNFQLQCLPPTGYNKLVIPIGIDSKAGGEIVFTVQTVQLDTDCKVILEDKLTNTFTDLSKDSYKAYVAANTAGTGSGR